jgi:chromosome partitioning protein
MCKTIAIVNQKGGISKTTSTFNLSAVLASKGNKVLMVDLDPQASLTISAGVEPLEVKYNITNILKKKPETIGNSIYELNTIPNLSIITSIIDLAALEMELQTRTAREKILKKSLDTIKSDYDFDYIFIDCPPQLSILTVNALSAADYVLIPCKTDYLSYRGLEQLETTISSVKELINEDIEVLGVIATLYERNIIDSNEILSLLQKNYNVLGIIKKTIEAVKGVYDGIPVVIRSPGADISKEYVKVAEAILNWG